MLRNPLARLLPFLFGCALLGPPAPWRSWESAHDRTHPLVGRVVDVRERRAISPDALIARLAAARFVLLGEKHDNPDHHRLQAWVIERLTALGQRRALAFEMLPVDVAEALARQRSTHPDDVDGIARAVDWERRGWPEWAIYRPVFAAAVAGRLPLVAADLSKAELARLRGGGAPPDSLRRLGLDQPLEPAALEALRAELVRGHCGALPEAALDGVVAIQRARDAQLASALAAGATRDGAILIAGAGHVGLDRGVPLYLARAAPESRSVSLALREVDPGAAKLEAYLDPQPPHDYLWLTPRFDVTDPCERFREQLRRLHPRS